MNRSDMFKKSMKGKNMKGIIILQIENARNYINLSCLKKIDSNCVLCFIHVYFPLKMVIIHYSRIRSEGFPFVVGGVGVGHVFAWLASCRRLSSSLVVSRRLSSSVVVVSSSPRLKFAAIGGSFCK